MLVLLQAAAATHLGAFSVVLAVGVLLGVFGHLIKSRALIVVAILIIGVTSAYFIFQLRPTGG
ncbi:MAG: hypothetical protein M3Z27_10340 [Actinomycetota bacterium]|nr:hypothetical protein [Actinomycetota bacterium]